MKKKHYEKSKHYEKLKTMKKGNTMKKNTHYEKINIEKKNQRKLELIQTKAPIPDQASSATTTKGGAQFIRHTYAIKTYVRYQQISHKKICFSLEGVTQNSHFAPGNNSCPRIIAKEAYAKFC